MARRKSTEIALDELRTKFSPTQMLELASLLKAAADAQSVIDRRTLGKHTRAVQLHATRLRAAEDGMATYLRGCGMPEREVVAEIARVRSSDAQPRRRMSRRHVAMDAPPESVTAE